MMDKKIVRESEEIVLLKEQEEEDEEEEALSLCDLPNNEENQIKKEVFGDSDQLAQDQDFDFNSSGGNLLKDSEMCTADEVFYQGQILPLRHSISLPSDSRHRMQNLNLMSSIPRSESMGERCRDANSSSRSSSIRSQRSSSSGSSSTCSNYKPRIRNQFHSHPSPSPQVRFSKAIHNTSVNNSSRNKSTLWNVFRVGLVTTPEIALQDLKNRSNKDFLGSRNSTSSSSSGLSNDNRMRIILSKKKKKKTFFLGSCKCSSNAVATVPTNVLIMNKNSTSTKTGEGAGVHEHEDKKSTKKQAMSRRHRTFEWLKQLSLEGPAEET